MQHIELNVSCMSTWIVILYDILEYLFPVAIPFKIKIFPYRLNSFHPPSRQGVITCPPVRHHHETVAAPGSRCIPLVAVGLLLAFNWGAFAELTDVLKIRNIVRKEEKYMRRLLLPSHWIMVSI